MAPATSSIRQTGSQLEGHFLAELAEDFRAVPVQAWTILIVATALSNLFLALA
jgi:hypothetical protein